MRHILWSVLLIPFIGFSQNYQLKQLTSGNKTSLRGLSVVTDDIAWVSGSNGQIGKTNDGGLTWEWMQPKGYEKLDFRDIEAFSGNRAIVVNAGSPAYILSTADGGKSWQEVYKNVDSAIFLDGMDFWDSKNGIVFGDPIHNQMQLLKTEDGGQSWKNISENLKAKLAEGEASFAASGTTIKTLNGGKVWIATGGVVSNIYFSDNYGARWNVFKCPILQGDKSTGPFSMAFINSKKGIVVGGDYLKDKENINNVLLTNDGGKTWRKSSTPVLGFRSGVAYLSDKVMVATGTSGTDISVDAGINWKNISVSSFNAVQKAKYGKLVLLAGNKGDIYKLDIQK